MIFGLEIGIALVVNIVLRLLNHPEFFFPLVATCLPLVCHLVATFVGAHFLPLAPIVHVLTYYVTGTLLCLVGVLVLLTAPSTTTLGGALLWAVLPGFLCAPILWLTALYDLIQGRNVLLQARKKLPA